MKATLPQEETNNARNYSHEKELVGYWKVVAYAKCAFSEPIDCRCWMGRSNSASVVYASIWIHGKECWFAGRGSAGGCGYHKQSAAIGDAISSAGVELSEPIHGVGDSAISNALEAIVKALGYRNYTVING